jgi:hypothetical protein
MTDPGEAIIRRDLRTNERFVDRADPVIRVAVDLLTGDIEPDVIEPDGTLRLDTAGKHRYRFVRAETANVHIYERITEEQP